MYQSTRQCCNALFHLYAGQTRVFRLGLEKIALSARMSAILSYKYVQKHPHSMSDFPFHRQVHLNGIFLLVKAN